MTILNKVVHENNPGADGLSPGVWGYRQAVRHSTLTAASQVRILVVLFRRCFILSVFAICEYSTYMEYSFHLIAECC